ncbi:LysR family transcriptional regulator [Mesorhizobium neociceri]|uniref:LysR family transcriptional regulator n=1 Tax=Mesorhizobium neociceri TaxID=1307853 RepID=A0A838B9V4_9HYPH|nr:LysR family transcriptional regulator [Mesorhizobium neociceri]MBA1143235.1 LysR family transcriptional regulator [Mesorhizobium neociceri]
MTDRLQQLALFVRTVETGSFSKTGRELGLSQPSVSRAIAALEERLGVKLLLRTTRRITATDAGLALLIRAREAIGSIDDAENAARGADSLSGVLRVALPTAYGVREIVPLLPAFLERHPALKINLMMSDRYEDLIAEGADLALRLGRQPDSSFVTHRLATTRRLLVASPDYLMRRGTPRTVAELAAHHCLGGPADLDRGVWTFHKNGKVESVTVDNRIWTGSGSGVVACAVAGLGIAVSSRWMCGDELRASSLVEVLGDQILDSIDAFVVFPAGRRPSQKARTFSDYLSEALTRRYTEG